MQNVMIKYLLVGSLVLTLSAPLQANGIDQTFTKKGSQTWGERFKRLFHRGDFNKSYAVVIGIHNYQDFSNLNTTNDPIRMKNYLLNEAGFDYVRLITGDQVNRNKIRSIMLDEMPRTLEENDRFLFYWSGHGTSDKRNGQQFGYLPLANSGKQSFSSMLSMSDLSQWDKRLSVKQSFYLLDACFSGLAGFQVKDDGREQTLQQIARPSRQILTAGLADEQTLVIDRLGGSVFTTALLDGLRGEADTESGSFQKDGIVSARELELYIKRRVGSEIQQSGWKKPITPLLTRLDHREGDFFFFSDKNPQPIAASPSVPLEVGVIPQSGNTSSISTSPIVRNTQKRIQLANNMTLLRIPAGNFMMGSKNGGDDEKPMHRVTIPKPFYMSQTEVTFDQYDAFATAIGWEKPKDQGWGRGTRPVINVSWKEANGYASWLSRNNQQGLQCRLPSEAEWEYAARAGTSTRYFWGDAVGKNNANCYECGSRWDDKQTAPVGSFKANAWGLQDMHGNVWEWVKDRYHNNYQGAPNNGSVWETGSSPYRVLRGGSWDSGTDVMRSANRFSGFGPVNRTYVIGFRVVCGLPSAVH